MDGVTKAAIVGGGAGTVLIAAAQTKPEDAASNISAWLHMLGVDRVPDVLANASTDTWATLAGLAAIAGATVSVMWFQARPKAEQQADPAPPEQELVRPALGGLRKEAASAALGAILGFLIARVDPFVQFALEVAHWTDFVRSRKRSTAMADLLVLRWRVLPLANDLAAIGRKYQPEYEALGISPDRLVGSVEAMMRPVENLYKPVWRAHWLRLPLWRPPMDVYPGQEEALLKKTRELEEAAYSFRAKVEGVLSEVEAAECAE